MQKDVPDELKIKNWDELPIELKSSPFLYTYFEERYHRELDRRTELSGMYFSHMSILALITGGFISALSILVKYQLCINAIFMATIVMIVAGGIALLFAFGFAVRSVFRLYGYMPGSKDILNQSEKLVPWLHTLNPGLSSSYIQDEMQAEVKMDLTRYYAEFGALNAFSNIQKSVDMQRATIAKVISILCCVLTFLGVFSVQLIYSDKEKPAEISIEKLSRSVDSTLKSARNQHEKEVKIMVDKPASQPEAQKPPARPVMQGGQVLTENARPQLTGGIVRSGDGIVTKK